MKSVAVIALALAACGDDGGGGNAKQLWLAPNGSELRLKLAEDEPPPF